MKSNTINLWDAMVENPLDSFKEYFNDEKNFIRENISKEDIVLDLGCGTGRTIKIISPISKQVIGIDNDSIAVELGKKRIKGFHNAEIILEDAEKMHFEGRIFNVVFIGLTFVNFGETKFKILKEIKKVLKDKGILIFSVYNENALKERMKNYTELEKREIKVDKKGTVKFGSEAISEQFTKKEIYEILNDSGFEILEIKKNKIAYLIKAKKAKKD